MLAQATEGDQRGPSCHGIRPIEGDDQMAIVLGLMSKKGGAGKSTIVKLLSSAVTHAGHKCLVIDLDPNKDILTWWAVSKTNDLAEDNLIVRTVSPDRDLFDLIDEYDDKVKFIIIDTKGEGVDFGVDLASVADALIIPCLNAKADRDRTLETINWHKDLKARAEDPSRIPPLHVVMSRVNPKLLTHVKGTPKPDGVGVRELERHYEIIEQLRPLDIMVPEKPIYQEIEERGALGMIIKEHKDKNDASSKMKLRHFEAAMALAILLGNCIFEERKMSVTNGS